jgi:hypothetical protein
LPLALPEEEEWRLDEHTKEVGRRGLAEAWAALARAVSPVDHHHRGAG